jgi:hypothetical protein
MAKGNGEARRGEGKSRKKAKYLLPHYYPSPSVQCAWGGAGSGYKLAGAAKVELLAGWLACVCVYACVCVSACLCLAGR